MLETLQIQSIEKATDAPPAGSLQFVAMDVLGPKLKKNDGTQFVIVVIYRYSKLKKAILAAEKTAMQIATEFLDHGFVLYGAPSFLQGIKDPARGKDLYDTMFFPRTWKSDHNCLSNSELVGKMSVLAGKWGRGFDITLRSNKAIGTSRLNQWPTSTTLKLTAPQNCFLLL